MIIQSETRDQTVYLPPQPAELCSDVTVTTLFVTKRLKELALT